MILSDGVSGSASRAAAPRSLREGSRPHPPNLTVIHSPGVQRIPGPHSIGLLAHAKAGGPQALPVLRYLELLGDADAPATAPLSPDDMALLIGTYVFGAGTTEQVEITIDRGQLQFTRKGATPRGLRHLGDRVFHPVGAAAVRIRFAAADRGSLTLTVHDPDLVLTARREQAG